MYLTIKVDVSTNEGFTFCDIIGMIEISPKETRLVTVANERNFWILLLETMFNSVSINLADPIHKAGRMRSRWKYAVVPMKKRKMTNGMTHNRINRSFLAAANSRLVKLRPIMNGSMFRRYVSESNKDKPTLVL
jgi:hypothetical protein